MLLTQNEKSYMVPAVVGMLCERVFVPSNPADQLPVCANVSQPPVPLHPGGGGLVGQLSKPGSVTKFAGDGLTEAISKQATKAEIRQQSMRVPRFLIALDSLGDRHAAGMSRRGIWRVAS